MGTKHKIVNSVKVNMGGILLDQPLPQGDINQVDPYLLIHHWKEVLPGGQHQRDVGVGPHPHRGFSPITFVYSGAVHHKDSMGHDSIVEAGGTQWMFSGKGITHSERPPAEFAQKGGLFEFIQIWLNAPMANKMDLPQYIPLTAVETPKYASADGLSRVDVVSGSFQGVRGAIEHKSKVDILRLDLQAGAVLDVEIKLGYATCFYVLDGEATVDGLDISDKQLVVLDQDSERIHLSATAATRILFLSGEPLNEKVSQYGPFVMNTQTEVMQALRDAQMGKMGILIED